MISTREDKADTVWKFPCLCRYEGIVVLFTDQGSGVVVASDDTGSPLGCFCENWDMRIFQPYKGVITLES